MFKRLLVVAFLLAAGCSSNNPAGPSAYNQTVTGSVDAFGTNRHSLNIPQSGNMTLTLTWADSTVDLNLYLTTTACTSLFSCASSTILQSATTLTGTSEKITRT